MQTSGAAGNISIYVTGEGISGAAVEWVSPTVTFPWINSAQLLDLGSLTLDTYKEGIQPSGSYTFRFYVAGNGADDCVLFDLVLIPIDEYAVESIDWDNVAPSTSLHARNTARNYLQIDGVSFLRQPGNLLHTYTTENVQIPYQYICPGWPILQRGTRQRLWFLIPPVRH